MNVHDALDRLDVIQERLSRPTPVRGYRTATVAWSAGLGGVGVLTQAMWVPDALANRAGYLAIWVGLASLGFLAISFDVGRRYFFARSRHERNGLLRTLITLLPAFAMGGVLTAALAARSDQVFTLLPGLWMLCFALASFSSLPRLPRGIGAIACFFFASGSWAVTQAAAVALSPWTMGGVFGTGLAWAAWLLARSPEGSDFPLDRRDA